MAGSSTAPITYSSDARKVQPLDWNAAWAALATQTSTTTLKVDHVQEKTTSHGVVFDNTPSATTIKVDHLAEQTSSHNILVDNNVRFGDDTNYAQITNGGTITYAGTAKRQLAMRPSFVAGRIAGTSKPTPVTVGCWAGYSCPIYNNDEEELFWRLHVPGRWDEASNITYNLIVCLAAAETAGDDFRFQLSWNHSDNSTGAINTDVTSVNADGDCSTGHTAQYSIFKLSFAIDYDVADPHIAAGDTLAGRVRRIASGGTEVDNEVIVLDHYLNFTVDKVFKA